MTRCSHHFCHRCIEPIARENVEWFCPVCRAVQRLPANELHRTQLVERIVENYQNHRPDRNFNIDQNGNENARPNEHNEGVNGNQNIDQNNVPGDETDDNNINLCLDHNLEFTVCKLTFFFSWVETNDCSFSLSYT